MEANNFAAILPDFIGLTIHKSYLFYVIVLSALVNDCVAMKDLHERRSIYSSTCKEIIESDNP